MPVRSWKGSTRAFRDSCFPPATPTPPSSPSSHHIWQFPDFDYSIVPSFAARILARVGLPMLRHAVKAPVHFSWGDRTSNVDDPENLGFACAAFAGETSLSTCGPL